MLAQQRQGATLTSPRCLPCRAGTLPGDYGYDPLGLGKDVEQVEKYRVNELLHARWAMLAAAGIIIPEGLEVRRGRRCLFICCLSALFQCTFTKSLESALLCCCVTVLCWTAVCMLRSAVRLQSDISACSCPPAGQRRQRRRRHLVRDRLQDA